MSLYGNGDDGLPPQIPDQLVVGSGAANAMMPNISLDLDLAPAEHVMGAMNGGDFLSIDHDLGSHPNLLYNTVMDSQAPQMQNDGDLVTNMNLFTGPGAGPLPLTELTNISHNGGSTLTEFTKRRNWSQRVLEEVQDFLHVLTPDGRIVYASPSIERLTGHKAESVIGRFISEFIHQDDSALYMREFNESIAANHQMRFFHRFKKADNTYTIFESHGHPHKANDANFIGGDGLVECSGYFMNARPYPTKNASLLDSFLEHKIENERLARRIDDLKREEQEDEQLQVQSSRDKPTPTGSYNDSESPTSTQNLNTMMPPPKPSMSKTALTQQNLEDASASLKQDSINDKMARYEGATHIETIEMLTGLRYRDGERSQGISTGDASPALIRGDAGIAILADKDGRGDKKEEAESRG